MKAWIARDQDGDLYAYDADPHWIEDVFVRGEGGTGSVPLHSGLAPDLKPGHKQPVELTATPLGEAVKGGGE